MRERERESERERKERERGRMVCLVLSGESTVNFKHCCDSK